MMLSALIGSISQVYSSEPPTPPNCLVCADIRYEHLQTCCLKTDIRPADVLHHIFRLLGLGLNASDALEQFQDLALAMLQLLPAGCSAQGSRDEIYDQCWQCTGTSPASGCPWPAPAPACRVQRVTSCCAITNAVHGYSIYDLLEHTKKCFQWLF